MQGSDDISISPIAKALSTIGFAMNNVIPNKYAIKKNQPPQKDDAFKHSGSDPLPPEERLEAAVKKFNAANELRLVAETNYFAELDNDYNLLQEYHAYKNPELNQLKFNPVSKDTVTATLKGKQIEIKCKMLEDGSKQHEINFDDGSRINYTTFAEGGKMKINGEEFEMPAGTILEVKSVNGRVFSQLIQTSDMKINVVNKPEIIDKAEEILNEYNQA